MKPKKLEAETLMDSNMMHIVYGSDDNFAAAMGISLVSLFENNKGVPIQVHIFDCGTSLKNIKRIEQVCDDYGQNPPHWMPGEDITGELGMDVAADRGSMAQFSYFLISRYIDESIDRILYLDCDTIIRKSIRELWEIELGDNTIAALADAFSKYYRMNVGLKPSDVMFNSGVILIDMKRWRTRGIEKQILDFMRQRHGYVEKGDQGVLNAVLSQKCCCFSPVFNAVTIFFDFSYQEMLRYRRPPGYYSEKEIALAVRDPVIVHYASSFLSKRPWMKGCQHPWVGEWLKYKNMSPWKREPLEEEKISWYVKILRNMPRRMMLCFAGFLQVYGRPWLNRSGLPVFVRKVVRSGKKNS